jgi:hypothetical protein
LASSEAKTAVVEPASMKRLSPGPKSWAARRPMACFSARVHRAAVHLAQQAALAQDREVAADRFPGDRECLGKLVDADTLAALDDGDDLAAPLLRDAAVTRLGI